MAYIGKAPVNGFHTKQSITGDNSTTSFALSFTVADPSSLIVSVGGVLQEPGVAYSLSGGGTNIVFSAAPSSTDTVYVHYLGTAIVQNLLDINGSEFILDLDGDTTLTADTDDRIDWKIAGVEHFSFSNSSGDTVVKPMTDAKDIIFQQYDGTEVAKVDDDGSFKIANSTLSISQSSSDVIIKPLTDAKDIKFQQYDGRTLLDINDGGYVGIANGAVGPGQLRLYEDTDLGTNYSAFQVGTQSGDITYTLPTADGSDGHALKTDGSGTLTWGAVAANTPTSADGQALGSASLEWSDLFLADGSTIQFGNDQEIKLTHVADTGLTLKHTATADDKPVSLTLQTGETDMAADDVIGKIDFQAPDEGAGTDAILVAAGIEAVSEGDFSASSNATKLSFKTASSEAAAEKASLSSVGNFTISGAIWENGRTIAADYTISSSHNAMSCGPITVNSGVSVTVPSGSVWAII